MSRENVELVREGLAAFLAGDLDRVFEIVHFWFVYTLSGGKVTRQDIFNSRAQAFDDTGLPD